MTDERFSTDEPTWEWDALPALRRALVEARRLHRFRGVPMVVSHRGRIVEIPPEKCTDDLAEWLAEQEEADDEPTQ